VRRKREWLAFDLTPLIDIIFLLLIFFMVFSVFKKDKFILNIDLPKASASKIQKNDKQIIIELSQVGLSLNGKKITFEDLEARSETFSKDSIILLSIDKNVIYDRIVRLLNIFKENKIENLSLMVKK
jgi:biopolymer transport protein ExbD